MESRSVDPSLIAKTSSHLNSLSSGRPLPSVTVIINNFNYGRFLNQAIESVLSQSYGNVELVVVDDGSTDDSRSVIRAYGSKLKFVFRPNGGQSAALNAGFAASTGEYIFLLDADDWYLPGKIETVVQHYIKNPDREWIFDPVWVMFPDGRTSAKPRYHGDIYVDARKLAQRGKTGPTAPPTSGFSFTRGLLERLLPMAEDMRIGSDSYLRVASVSIAPGIQLCRPLTAQRIHDNNAGTLRSDKLLQKARQHLLTARELRRNFPIAVRFSHKIFARAAADYIRCMEHDAECQSTISTYLKSCTNRDLLDVIPRTIYHLFRWIGSMRGD